MICFRSRALSCLVALFLLSLPCAAEDESRTDFELAFAEGVWAFSQSDYVRALEYFRKAHDELPEDSFAHYMLGLSYLRLGKAEEAENAITASLYAKIPPPIPRSRILVDLGAAQLAAGHAQEAVRSLKKALRELASNDPVRPVALHHQATALGLVGRQKESAMAREQARELDPALDPEDLPITTPRVSEEVRMVRGGDPKWSEILSVTAVHDSNPNLLSEDLLLPLPSPGDEPVDGNSPDTSLEADIAVSYYPGRLPRGWSLSLDLGGGGSFHQELDYLNLARARGVVRLDWDRSGRWSLGFRSGAEQIRLDGSSYLLLLDAGASLTFSPAVAHATRLEVSLLDRGYAGHRLADPRRDGEEVRIGLRQIRYFGGQDRYISLGVAAGDRSAGPEFERALWGGEVQAVLPVGSRWTLDLSAWLTEEDFGDPASNLFTPQGPARNDQTWGTSAELSYLLWQKTRALVRGIYTERSSNVDLGEGLPNLGYRRTILRTGVVWTF